MVLQIAFVALIIVVVQESTSAAKRFTVQTCQAEWEKFTEHRLVDRDNFVRLVPKDKHKIAEPTFAQLWGNFGCNDKGQMYLKFCMQGKGSNGVNIMVGRYRYTPLSHVVFACRTVSDDGIHVHEPVAAPYTVSEPGQRLDSEFKPVPEIETECTSTRRCKSQSETEAQTWANVHAVDY